MGTRVGWAGRDRAADCHGVEAGRTPTWLRTTHATSHSLRHVVAIKENVPRRRNRRRAGLSNFAGDGLSSLAISTDQTYHLGHALGNYGASAGTCESTAQGLHAPAGRCRSGEWYEWTTLREFLRGPGATDPHGTIHDGHDILPGRFARARPRLSQAPAVLWAADRTKGCPSLRRNAMRLGA